MIRGSHFVMLVFALVATPTFAQYSRPMQRPLQRPLPMAYWSPEKTEKELLEKGINSTPFSKYALLARERHGGKATDFINEFSEPGGNCLAMLSRKSGKYLMDMQAELMEVNRIDDLLTLIALHPQRERIVALIWKFRASFAKSQITEALLADVSGVLQLGRLATLEQIEKVYADSQKNVIELLLDP